MPLNRKERLRAAFGLIIRDLRMKAGLSQERLSFKAKVHRTYIGDLERGLKSPTLDVIDAIAVALGTEPHQLVEQAAALRNRPAREWGTLTESKQRVRRRS